MIKFILLTSFGAVFGFLNGVISSFFLKRYIKASNKRFFTVFGLLSLYKLLFLISSVWFLKNEKVIIVLLYCVACIFVDVIVVVVFFKSYGVKRDT